MNFLRQLKAAASPLEGGEGEKFRAMQLGLMRRIYAMSLAMDLFLMARDLYLGTGLAWIAVANAAILIAAIAVSGRSEGGRQAAAWLIMGDWIFSVTWAGLHWPHEGFAGPFMYLPIFGIIGAVMGDMRLGSAAFAASFAVMAGVVAALPAGAMALPYNRALYTNVLLVIVVSYLLTLCAWALFARLLRQLGEQESQLKAGARARDAMLATLFDGLSQPLQDLARLSGDASATAPDFRGAVNSLSEVVETTRMVLREAMVQAPHSGSDPVAAFRLQIIRWTARINLSACLFVALRVTAMGDVTRPLLWGQVIAFGTVFLIAEFKPAWQLTAAWLQMLSIFLVVTASTAFWPPARPAPALIFLSLIPYLAVLFSGFRMAALLSLLSLGVLAALALLQGQSWGEAGFRMASDLAVLSVCTLICWYLLGRLMSGLIAKVQQRSADLSRAAALRARLSATLFHDVANPLLAIRFVLENALSTGRLDAPDRQSLARLERRLSGLIEAARRMLAVDGPAPEFMQKNIALDALLSETRELFQSRLAEKGLTLDIAPMPGLVCHAVPELLRESVLANLLSNAIKFSPRGGMIEVSVRAGESIELRVRDHGAGPNPEILEALNHGGVMASTQGTEGEPGHGYGLRLAAEYLGRMGGALHLEAAEGGGCVAVMRLAKAGPAA